MSLAGLGELLETLPEAARLPILSSAARANLGRKSFKLAEQIEQQLAKGLKDGEDRRQQND